MSIQALWANKSPILQLPHVTEDMLRHFVNKKVCSAHNLPHFKLAAATSTTTTSICRRTLKLLAVVETAKFYCPYAFAVDSSQIREKGAGVL